MAESAWRAVFFSLMVMLGAQQGSRAGFRCKAVIEHYCAMDVTLKRDGDLHEIATGMLLLINAAGELVGKKKH